jgi:hypothetical protein
MDAVLYIQAAREDLQDRERSLASVITGSDYDDEEED